MFQRVVLILALAVGAGLAIAPPWEGLRPTGGGNLSRELEPIGHYPVFSPPRPCERIERKRSSDPKSIDVDKLLGIEPPSQSAKDSPYECEAGESPKPVPEHYATMNDARRILGLPPLQAFVDTGGLYTLDDARRFAGLPPLEAKTYGELWRGIRIAWVRVGLEFAALIFVTALLLVMGQLFRRNETHPSKPAEGA